MEEHYRECNDGAIGDYEIVDVNASNFGESEVPVPE